MAFLLDLVEKFVLESYLFLLKLFNFYPYYFSFYSLEGCAVIGNLKGFVLVRNSYNRKYNQGCLYCKVKIGPYILLVISLTNSLSSILDCIRLLGLFNLNLMRIRSILRQSKILFRYR